MTTVTSAFDLTPFLTGLARSADVTRLAEKAGWAVVALVQASMGPRSGERGRFGAGLHPGAGIKPERTAKHDSNEATGAVPVADRVGGGDKVRWQAYGPDGCSAEGGGYRDVDSAGRGGGPGGD